MILKLSRIALLVVLNPKHLHFMKQKNHQVKPTMINKCLSNFIWKEDLKVPQTFHLLFDNQLVRG